MKTAAIATIRKPYLLINYGSFFQHYALRTVLKRVGFNPFRVVCAGENCSILSMCLDQAKDWIRPLFWIIKRLPNQKVNRKRISIRNRSYWKFLWDYSRLIGKFNEKPQYDINTIGVRGGDQVLYSYPDEHWFSKVPNGNVCITYSVSADWLHVQGDKEWRDYIANKLRRFTAVGVREMVGVDIVKDLVRKGAPVSHVADPVQLLTAEDFRAIQSHSSVFKKPALFCYLVNIRSADDLRIAEYERLAEMLGCELRMSGIQGAELFIPRKYFVLYSPRKFLRALDDAKYFITNSYHGSVLAMQYQKSFLSIWQNSLPGTNQNERQKELMHKFGIESNWVDYKLPAEEWRQLLDKPIDWSRVNKEATEWRNFSLNWLIKAINK